MSEAAALAHALATGASFVWAWQERRARPVRPGAWRIAVATTALLLVGDFLVVLTPFAWALAVLLLVPALILGGALLLVSVLHGWPSRALVALGVLGLLGPFVPWAGL